MRRAGPRRRPSLGQHDRRALTCRRPARPAIAHPFLRAAANSFRRFVYDERNSKILTTLWEFIHAENETGRATRSEFLENLCLLVECNLARMRIKCGRVGHRRKALRRGRKNDFVGLPTFVQAQWCNLSLSTVSHLHTLLRRSGYLHGPSRTDKVGHIAQPCELQSDGSYEWLTAVRRFDFTFFVELGLGPWLAFLRAAKKPIEAGEKVNSSKARALIASLAAGRALDGPPDG